MPGIFISYRREDASGHAGRIYDALRQRFDEEVFMDVGIEPGVDFVEQIDHAVGSCRVLVVVIGPRWSTMEDAKGRRRLEHPGDLIRVEVEAGLRKPGVRVIPVLVQGATMPSAEELPRSLGGLARRNALELSDARWSYDVDRLTATVERVMGMPARASEASEGPQLYGVQKYAGAGNERIERPPTPGSVRGRPRERPVSADWLRRRSRLLLPVLALALAAGIAVVIVADQPGSSPSAPQGESEIYRDSGSHVSPDKIEVSNLLATGEHKHPTIGDRIKIAFSLKNVGSKPLTFDETFIAARDPSETNKDFAEENMGKVLAPGDAVEISSTIVVDARGLWEFWPCYSLPRGSDYYCPDEWRSFQVPVGQ
jgi:hypothetical protein